MGAGAISADISGDGCPERLVVSGAIVVAPGIAAGGDRRASLAGPGPSGAGRPRSALLVGDWACSGALGPAWRTPYDGSMRTWRSWAALVNGDAPTIITGPPGDGPLTVVAPRAGRCAVVRTASNALGGAPRSHPQATLGNDTP